MPVYEFSRFRIDTATRELTRDGLAVPLPPRVHDLLVHLLKHHQQVVTKQELLAQVWRRADVSEAVIHRAVVTLREALGDKRRSASMVRTVHGIGYRFVAVITEREHADGPPAGGASSPGASPAPGAPLTRPAERAGDPPRVALQAFENATGDTAHDWACWGLPRLVCETLASRPDLALVNLDAVARVLDALPSHTAEPGMLGGLLGARWTVSGRIEAGGEEGLRLAYTVHGGPAGTHPLCAPDVPRLASALGDALVELAARHEGWAVRPFEGDAFASQALARAQAHIARTEWGAAANLLKVVLDFDPANTAARLLWLTVLPQLHDDAVFREGERLLAEAQRLGDVRLQAATHEILGRASFNRNEPGWSVTGRRHLEEALRLARPWAHEDWVLRIHINLGYVLQLQCDHAGARRHYEAALRRLAHGGNTRFQAAALNNRALIECFQERPLVAANMAHEALGLSLRENQFHTAVSCRSTLALAELEVGWLQRAERRVVDNLGQIAAHPDLHADSTAWALFVAAQVGFMLRGGGPALAGLKAAHARTASTSAHSDTLLAATKALLPLLENSPEVDADIRAAQALLDAMERSEQAQLREHTHHMARLALECALRSRSGSMLWRIRHFLGMLPGVRDDPGLRRALCRTEAAEQLWRGEPDAAIAALQDAVAGPPGGRLQALARLDLVGLLLAQGLVADAASHLSWVPPWLEALPEGLAAHAGVLALQGHFDAAVDAQLAALRMRRGRIPPIWYAQLEHYAQGRSPSFAASATLLTLG